MERIFRLMQMGWSTDHRPNPASLVHQRERFSEVFRTIGLSNNMESWQYHMNPSTVIREGEEVDGTGRSIPREGAVCISGRPVRGASSRNIPAELSCGDSGVPEIFTGRIISCPSCVTPEGKQGNFLQGGGTSRSIAFQQERTGRKDGRRVRQPYFRIPGSHGRQQAQNRQPDHGRLDNGTTVSF